MIACGSFLALQRPRAGGDRPLIKNFVEFEATFKRAQILSQDIMARYEQGQEPQSEEERQKLREALRLVRGMTDFSPSSFGPLILQGKIERALGDDGAAEQTFMQAANLVPLGANESERVVIAEAYVELGRMQILRGNLARAEEFAKNAQQLAPRSVTVLNLLARVRIQQKNIKEAKALLEASFAVDATNPETRSLIELINATGHGRD